ncbi:hypothetical protein G3G77_004790 [Salmonella enterica]|nr:hypothetical protein [Salmonella enterica]EEH5466563.1 hypothetical protein [Salmonella enterica]EEH7556040.1 hypothetical protein [Salmonella enterica]
MTGGISLADSDRAETLPCTSTSAYKDVATLLIHATARGIPLPGASVPRPGGHGTGGVSAPARRRCDFTPSTRLLRIALQAAFAA